MQNEDIELSVQVTSDSIKKKFKTLEPIKAIFELIWNGLDACADRVVINIERNELDGLVSITVSDNGNGINFDQGEECGFLKFDDSNKKADINTHGKDGIGRFSFHKLSNNAEWHTKNNGNSYKATIHESNLHKIILKSTKDTEYPFLMKEKSGTTVQLTGFNASNGSLPSDEKILNLLSCEFGWFLAYHQTAKILFDGVRVHVPKNDVKHESAELEGYEFNISVFRWHDKPTSEKSYIYFTDKNNKVVYKDLSRFNKKLGFYTSAVISSKFNSKFDNDLYEMDGSRKVISAVSKVVYDMQTDLYNSFLRARAEFLIENYENKGFFDHIYSNGNDLQKWNLENTKRVVKELYIADPRIFNNLSEKPAKILVRLLDRILVSNENGALFEVLEGVLDLDSEHVERLADLIQNTKLENIISTVEIISRRLQVIKMLRSIMVNDYKNVLETPDLQQVIESNSWLFGEQYSILGAEEDDFNRTAKNLRDSIRGIKEITVEDVEDVTVEGSKRQVDLFLASKRMIFDENNNKIFKCVIIEIKRPSISLSKKHLRQLEDYAEIIQKSSAFGISENLRFDLILVGRKVSNQDTSIQGSLEGMKPYHEKGLVGLSDNRRIKSYVKDWLSLLDEHELSANYILERLKPKLPDYSLTKSKDLIEVLQEPA
ncbi:ATP-binding protein [Psychrobacter cibarius]|nr:ATP-binding protein [Psychrobacter cibarius]